MVFGIRTALNGYILIMHHYMTKIGKMMKETPIKIVKFMPMGVKALVKVLGKIGHILNMHYFLKIFFCTIIRPVV